MEEASGRVAARLLSGDGPRRAAERTRLATNPNRPTHHSFPVSGPSRMLDLSVSRSAAGLRASGTRTRTRLGRQARTATLSMKRGINGSERSPRRAGARVQKGTRVAESKSTGWT